MDLTVRRTIMKFLVKEINMTTALEFIIQD